MPEKTNRITRTTKSGLRFTKVDSWFEDDIWDALNEYMAINDRKRAPAIKLLVKKALELEGLMKGVKANG